MNERVMQFRIGMFVIVAGLVLTMLLIWFGESPVLFQDRVYLTVHYGEAPGIAVGIPVRKSGIRVGEVVAIEFDHRPGKGDGVLVTMAIEPKYRIAAGSVPRLARALIGDVSIDLLPGPEGAAELVMGRSLSQAQQSDRIIEGSVSPDPTLALAAATQAFERAGNTLSAIDQAAKGVAKVADKAQNLDEFLTSFRDMGRKVSTLADNLDQVVQENRGNVGPAIENLRASAQKFNAAFDEETQKNLKITVKNLASGSARLDEILTDVRPLAADLGTAAGRVPQTSIGQSLTRINRISFEIGLLTSQLADPSGKLNRNGSLQKLLTQSDLYDNVNRASLGVQDVFSAARPVIHSLGQFAERIARDPSAIGRGVLERR